MRKLAALLLALVFLGLLWPSTAPRALLVETVRVWNPDGPLSLPQDVLLSAGRIESLGADLKSSDAQVLDGRGMVLMPGLINAHTHMLRTGACADKKDVGLHVARQIALNFDVELSHGVTTLVDLGAPLAGAIAMRELLAKPGLGRAPSPVLRVAGPVITAKGGYPLDYVDPELARSLEVVLEVETPEAARAVVRRLARSGVDVLKVATMERSFNEKRLPHLNAELMRAVVEEGHKHGLPVFAHAHTVLGYRYALEAGVDVIAHSSFEPLPDTMIQRIVDSGTAILPTLWTYSVFLHVDRQPGLVEGLAPEVLPRYHAELKDIASQYKKAHDHFPDGFIMKGLRKSRLHTAIEAARSNLARLHAAGARIGYGTDTAFCFSQHGAVENELLEMADAGMPARDVLRAATQVNASILGRKDLGVIRPGATADLVLLEKDPSQDLAQWKAPLAVFKGGRLVRCDQRLSWCEAEPERPGLIRTLRIGWTLIRALYL